MLPSIIAAAVIVLAGLGVGLYFGVFKDSADETTASTLTSVAASTTAPTTEAASTTLTSIASTTTETTSLTTTTSEPTTTTIKSETAVVKARVRKWMNLLESIPTSDKDLTPQIVAFLTPEDKAQERAAELVEMWTTPNDPDAIIESDPWKSVSRVKLDSAGTGAVAISTYDIVCRDGLTTRGLDVTDWSKVNGTWLRNAELVPVILVKGPQLTLGQTIVVGNLMCAPDAIHELKHLAAKGGPTTSGMFLAVSFIMRNESKKDDITPAGWRIALVDAGGKTYGLSAKADDWWYEDVEERAEPLLPGEEAYIWYTFEVPAGLDLEKVKFQVLPPTL